MSCWKEKALSRGFSLRGLCFIELSEWKVGKWCIISKQHLLLFFRSILKFLTAVRGTHAWYTQTQIPVFLLDNKVGMRLALES